MIDRKKILNALADYMYSTGCGCCGNIERSEEAEGRLGKLLRVQKYKDGSGYDFSKYRTNRKRVSRAKKALDGKS